MVNDEDSGCDGDGGEGPRYVDDDDSEADCSEDGDSDGSHDCCCGRLGILFVCVSLLFLVFNWL